MSGINDVPNSCATCCTVEFSKEDLQRWEKGDIRDSYQLAKDLTAALRYKVWKSRYKVWKDYFCHESYDGYEIEMELPEFDENYEYYLQKNIQTEIKHIVKK